MSVAVERNLGTEPRDKRLGELYVRHAPDAVRLAFLLTSDPQVAQDVAQEAFIKVAGRFRHLREPDSFDAYLRRTVVNLCLSYHRHRKVEQRYVAAEGARIERSAPGTTMEPSGIAERDELRTALMTLPQRQRAAVVLRYYHDLSEQQVAEALGCSVGAARALVARAMETLRRHVASGAGEGS